MTHQLDVARGRDIIGRWCALAEQRLEYLTELFETGRWRRYHSELAFLENIQEAKSAVEIWRGLSMREASRDNTAIDMSWLGHARATKPQAQALHDQVRQPAAIAAEPRSVTSIVPDSGSFRDDAPSTPAIDVSADLTRDIAAAIAERYPLLRNAM
jgi:uncharacterized repeat protein (TIGR03809 family)